MLTGVGGGMACDVLLAEIPTVLRAGSYAAAALAGVVVVDNLIRVPHPVTVVAGAVLCFGLPLLAIRRGWHLPVARQLGQPDAGPHATEDRRDEPARGP